jgi:hypothetical protein
MNLPHRIKVKYLVQDPTALELSAIARLFHRWIQEQRVEGLLLDVANYKHVHQGPGVLLIGHEADYALDLSAGRPGLVYDRKRQWESLPSLQERLRIVFRGALAGCQALVSEPGLSLHFRPDEAELTFLDRLRTPNRREVWHEIEGDVRAVLDELYGNDYTLEQGSSDPRRPLTLYVHAAGAPTLTTLLNRLGRAAATNGSRTNGHV